MLSSMRHNSGYFHNLHISGAEMNEHGGGGGIGELTAIGM